MTNVSKEPLFVKLEVMYRPLTSSIFDISFLQNIISYYTLPDAALRALLILDIYSVQVTS